MYKHVFKRLIDLAVSSVLMLVISPFILLVAAAIKLDSPGPVFFSQERVGKGLSRITVYKFRSMTNEKRTVGNKPIIGKAEGVTTVGYFIRRFKIDELPQLWGVFTGDLTLIGPRPSVASQLDRLTDRQKGRYDVTPGLTGLTQVSGGIHLTWDERIEKDLEYISKLSFDNDVRILKRTVSVIIRGEKYFLDKPLELV